MPPGWSRCSWRPTSSRSTWTSGGGWLSRPGPDRSPRRPGRGHWLVHTLRRDAKTLRWLTETFGDGSPDGLRESVGTLLCTAPGAERLLLCFDQVELIFLLPSKQDQARYLALIDGLRRMD